MAPREVCPTCLGECLNGPDGTLCSDCGGSGYQPCYLCVDTGRIADDIPCPRCADWWMPEPALWPHEEVVTR